MILSACLRLLRFLVLTLVVLTSSAAAQNATSQIDYDRWARVAERAERVIDAERASTPALEELRAQLVEYRTRFSAAETANAARHCLLAKPAGSARARAGGSVRRARRCAPHRRGRCGGARA